MIMREARGNQLCSSYEIASVLYPRERKRGRRRGGRGERGEERKIEEAIPRTRPFSFEKLLKSTLGGAG